MSAHALILVVIAAVLHATWNTLTKRARDGFSFLWATMALASLLLAPISCAFGASQLLDPRVLPSVIASGAIHALYYVTLTSAYRRGDFALVYPVARGLGVALAPPLAFALLGERMSTAGIVGVVVVVVGIILSGLAARSTGFMQALGAGGGHAVATGALIAAYTLVDAAAARRCPPLPYVAFSNLVAVLLLTPYALGRDSLLPEVRRSGRAIAVASTMSLTGYVLVLFAYQSGKTGYVVAAREVSIVLSAFVGSVLMGEGRVRVRMAAASVILGGVAIIAVAK